MITSYLNSIRAKNYIALKKHLKIARYLSWIIPMAYHTGSESYYAEVMGARRRGGARVCARPLHGKAPKYFFAILEAFLLLILQLGCLSVTFFSLWGPSHHVGAYLPFFSMWKAFLGFPSPLQKFSRAPMVEASMVRLEKKNPNSE